MSDEYTDPNLDTWTPKTATAAGECEHCNDPYKKGEPILVSEGGRTLHESCWELYLGYMNAMAKD